MTISKWLWLFYLAIEIGPSKHRLTAICGVFSFKDSFFTYIQNHSKLQIFLGQRLFHISYKSLKLRSIFKCFRNFTNNYNSTISNSKGGWIFLYHWLHLHSKRRCKSRLGCVILFADKQ